MNANNAIDLNSNYEDRPLAAQRISTPAYNNIYLSKGNRGGTLAGSGLLTMAGGGPLTGDGQSLNNSSGSGLSTTVGSCGGTPKPTWLMTAAIGPRDRVDECFNGSVSPGSGGHDHA